MIPMHSNEKEYLDNKRVVRYFHQIFKEPQPYYETVRFFGLENVSVLIRKLDYFKIRTKTIIDSRYPLITGVINDS